MKTRLLAALLSISMLFGSVPIMAADDYSFGLGESSFDHRRREEFPAISIYRGK